jgi:hypothetical protein
MEGRNDSPQSRIVLAEYWFRSVASEHMHAFCMRWLSQYAGWRHAGAVTSPISFTESDVASAPTSLALIWGLGIFRTQYQQPESGACGHRASANVEHLKALDIQGGAQRAVGAASVTHSWTEANTAGRVLLGVDIQAVVTSTPINEALTDNANSDNW